MKIFIKINLVLFFAIISIFILIILFPRFNADIKNDLKFSIANKGVYKIAVLELQKQTDTVKDNNTEPALDGLVDLISQEVNQRYLKDKTEKFIDEMDYWLNDASQTPPVISFQDIKTKIISQNADLVTVLEEINREYKINKQEIEMQAIESGGNPEQMPEFDFQNLITGDYSIPVGQNLLWLKSVYQFGNKSLYLLIITEMVLFIAVILMSDTLKSKMSWASFALLTALLLNSFFLFVIFLAQKGLLKLLGNENVPVFLTVSGTTITSIIVDKLIQTGIQFCIFYFALFLIGMISASLYKDKSVLKMTTNKKQKR